MRLQYACQLGLMRHRRDPAAIGYELIPHICRGGGGGKNGSHRYCARIGSFRGGPAPVGATVVDAPMGGLAIRRAAVAEMAAAAGYRPLTPASGGGGGGQWRPVAGAEWRGMEVCAAGRSAFGVVAVACAMPQPEVPWGLTGAVSDEAGGLMRLRPVGADSQRRRGAGSKSTDGRGAGSKSTDDRGASVKPTAGRGAGSKSTAGRGAGSKSTDGRDAGIKSTDGRDAGIKSTAGRGAGSKPADGRGAGEWVSFIRLAAARHMRDGLIWHAWTPQIRSGWGGGAAYGLAADAGREVFGNGE